MKLGDIILMGVALVKLKPFYLVMGDSYNFITITMSRRINYFLITFIKWPKICT